MSQLDDGGDPGNKAAGTATVTVGFRLSNNS